MLSPANVTTFYDVPQVEAEFRAAGEMISDRQRPGPAGRDDDLRRECPEVVLESTDG